MACVANLQYEWALFVNPIDAKYHWGRSAIQIAFTIFVLIETWLIPVEGYLVDKFGPRWVVLGGGILVAIAWVMNSMADSLSLLYVGAALGGVGTGCVYGTCVGNALKWFPGRRGLAAGVTASGFGAGAALTIGPISTMINASGYEHAFLVFGLLKAASYSRCRGCCWHRPTAGRGEGSRVRRRMATHRPRCCAASSTYSM
jgi:OFA family oxalate/formate antiporter-like MFS transporter